jgi:hypothetical protein
LGEGGLDWRRGVGVEREQGRRLVLNGADGTDDDVFDPNDVASDSD